MTGRPEQETSNADEAAAVPVTAEDFLASPVSGGAPPAGSGPAESAMATVPGQEGAPEPALAARRAGGQGGLAEAAGRVRAAVAALLQRAEEQRTRARRPPVSPPPDGAEPPDGTDGAPAQAGPPGPPAPPRDGAGRAETAGVPRLLAQAAAWSWRILLVGLLIYVGFRVASTLRLVVLPCLAALLLTALLQPLTSQLRRRTGMPSLAATWCTIGAAVIVLAGIGTLAANRVSADYPRLSKEVSHTAIEVRTSLAGPPFHLNSARIEDYSNQIVHFLNQHQSMVAGTVVTGGRIVLEVLTGLILTIFITFFLLKDGDRIWSWLISGLRPGARQRAGNAGAAAWSALVNYVRGTTVVAAIHAVVIGLALWLLGVPLLVPLVILVFLAAFVPLLGILVAGALAILVTLGTKGLLAALILLAVFVLENQVESHLLQPLVVGRIVRLHPLAIILVLAVGGIIAGIAGAIVAVPTAAALAHAWPYLRGEPGPDDGGHGPPGTAPAGAEGDSPVPAGTVAEPPGAGPAGTVAEPPGPGPAGSG